VHAEVRTVERRYRTSGTLKALRSAEVTAITAGIIESITAEEGDRVVAGQILARLDGRTSGLQAAADQLRSENLARELSRLERVAPGALSAEEIDKQRYAVAEAQAAARLSGHQAKLTLVRAPFSGTITKRHVDLGNLANGSAPLFTLQDLGTIRVELFLPEREAARVPADAPVTLELLDGSRFDARLLRRAPVVDALTGTVKFTVESTQPPPGAVPGAFVRASVLTERAVSVPALPTSAILDVAGVPHVWVLREGKARRVPVDLGVSDGEYSELRGGLAPTDAVVKQGGGGIHEGMPIKPLGAPDAMPADAKTSASPHKAGGATPAKGG
jgi:membrane fusion protein (multidrug efflux system)